MIHLNEIQGPGDLRDMSREELDALCGEIRGFLVRTLSKTGGHLASNLGAVELTVALHRVYDTARDRLVFDVGHQCYTHKILTGRMAGFEHFREIGGMSGFPKPNESVHDAFIAGHASNSVSVALGMARARTALGEDYDVVAVIGDGALNGGMAFEGLSDAGHSGEPIVIVLNDNGMSISRGVGGLADMLSRMRTRPEYINFKRWYRKVFAARVPFLYKITHGIKRWIKERVIQENIFDDLGFEYLGPIDGHDIGKIEAALRWAKAQQKPCFVHVITKKGQGYLPAERAPELFHGVGAFDLQSGLPTDTKDDFSAVFGRTLAEIAAEDGRVVAITAAMREGTGLVDFQKRYPDRFFDVGIAEEHAVAMAGGMAAQGLIPVFAVYSSFFQRSYDMLIHDISLMDLHAVFAVDRAGIVGKDGQTHQGAFDVAYLSTVPGMTIYAPSSFSELQTMLRRAVLEDTGPVAVRYPRGGENFHGNMADGPCVLMREGKDATIAAYGGEVFFAMEAARLLEGQGVMAEVVKINRLAPLDASLIERSVEKTGVLVVPEDVCRAGGMGERILAALAVAGVSLRAAKLVNLGDGILENGAPEDLRKMKGLDGEGIAEAVRGAADAKSKA